MQLSNFKPEEVNKIWTACAVWGEGHELVGRWHTSEIHHLDPGRVCVYVNIDIYKCLRVHGTCMHTFTHTYLHVSAFINTRTPTPWQHSCKHIHMSTAMYMNIHCASQHHQWLRIVAVPHPSPSPGQSWDFLGRFEENGIGGWVRGWIGLRTIRGGFQ